MPVATKSPIKPLWLALRHLFEKLKKLVVQFAGKN
jgi:hypothetical protein